MRSTRTEKTKQKKIQLTISLELGAHTSPSWARDEVIALLADFRVERWDSLSEEKTWLAVVLVTER